jgi:toxin ParE1/3/4
MKVRWSPTAVSDLVAIREYIAEDSPAAARKVAQKIKDAIQTLRRFPLSGKTGREPETRELVIPGTSYIAVYSIQSDEVIIATILHGRQNWPKPSSRIISPS